MVLSWVSAGRSVPGGTYMHTVGRYRVPYNVPVPVPSYHWLQSTVDSQGRCVRPSSLIQFVANLNLGPSNSFIHSPTINFRIYLLTEV